MRVSEHSALQAAIAVSDLVRDAYAHGATHVTLHMEKVEP